MLPHSAIVVCTLVHSFGTKFPILSLQSGAKYVLLRKFLYLPKKQAVVTWISGQAAITNLLLQTLLKLSNVPPLDLIWVTLQWSNQNHIWLRARQFQCKSYPYLTRSASTNISSKVKQLANSLHFELLNELLGFTEHVSWLVWSHLIGNALDSRLEPLASAQSCAISGAPVFGAYIDHKVLP